MAYAGNFNQNCNKIENGQNAQNFQQNNPQQSGK